MKPCVIIPTYNNSGTLEQVVRGALAQGLPVLVVDDGSNDGTTEVIDGLGRVEGLAALSHGLNLGKGAALRTGFREAFRRGFTHAVSIDSDAQHLPEEIPRFLEEGRLHPDALVLGNRDFESAQVGRGSRFGRSFSNLWTFIETGQWLPDTQTGFRLYPLDSITSLHLEKNGYDLEVEVLVKAIWTGVPIRSVPVSVVYFEADRRVSHFRPGLDFLRIALLNTGLVSRRICFPSPLRARLCKAGSHRFSLPVLLMGPILALLLAPLLLACALRLDSIAPSIPLSLAGAGLALLLLLRRIELWLAAVTPVILAQLFALGWSGFSGAALGGLEPMLLTALFATQAALVAWGQLHRFRTGQDHSASVSLAVALSSLLGGSVSAILGSAAILLTAPFFFRALLIRGGANGTPAVRNLLAGLWVFRLMVGRGLWHLVSGLFRRPGVSSQRAASLRIHRIGSAIRHDLPIGRRSYRNEQRIDPEQAYVVVCNHESMYDITAILALPLPLQILVKDWVFKTPVMGHMARAAGYLKVEGDSRKLLEQARASVANGFSILVFPEGTRTRSGKLGRFHNGAFAIARSLGIPVLPICQVNTREVVPRNSWWVGDHDAILSVLEPIFPAGTQGEFADRNLARETRNRIRVHRDELWSETQCGPDWQLPIAGLFRHMGRVSARRAKRRLARDPLLFVLPGICAGCGPVQVVGCRQGLLSARLMLAFPERSLLSVFTDIDRARIARAAFGPYSTVRFRVSDLTRAGYDPAEWTVLADVLGDQTPDRRALLLGRLRDTLPPGARLLFRDRRDGDVDWQALLEASGFVFEQERQDACRAGDQALIAVRAPGASGTGTASM